MENKSTEQLNMDLPPYTTSSNFADTRKKRTLAFSLAVFLVVIIVAGTLIGVYMTQKHIEQLVTVTFCDPEGERVEQTVSINEEEEAAVIYVNSHKFNGTLLFDYDMKLIAFRKQLSSECYVLEMEGVKTPALSSLLEAVEYFHDHNATVDDQITYNIVLKEEANPADLGSNVYLLCSDATIYWSEHVDFPQQRTHDKIKFDFSIGPFHIKGSVSW